MAPLRVRSEAKANSGSVNVHRQTQITSHAESHRPLRSPRALYREHVADARQERLFLSSVAFFLTFAIVRAITYAIHAGKGPLHDVVVGSTHLHHLVWGILLLLGVGYLWLAQVGTGIGRSLDWPSRLTALLYGVGAALTLDEFALCCDWRMCIGRERGARASTRW